MADLQIARCADTARTWAQIVRRCACGTERTWRAIGHPIS
jgi:hypothetical protein